MVTTPHFYDTLPKTVTILFVNKDNRKMMKVRPFSGKCMNNCNNSSFAYGKSYKKGTALHGYGSLKNVTNAFHFH